MGRDADRGRAPAGDRAPLAAGPHRPPSTRPGVSVRRAVLEFTAGGLVAMLLVGIAVVYLTHLSSVRDAERSAAEIAELQAHLAVEPNLTRDVIIGDTTALTEIDRIVRKALVHAPTERIKIID